MRGKRFTDWSTRVALAWLGFAAAVSMAACARQDLGGFPPYPPTEPFLEERALWERRVQVLEADAALREEEYWARHWEETATDWQGMEERLAAGERERQYRQQRRLESELAANAASAERQREMELRISAGEAERRDREERREGTRRIGTVETLEGLGKSREQVGSDERERRRPESAAGSGDDRFGEERLSAWERYLGH